MENVELLIDNLQIKNGDTNEVKELRHCAYCLVPVASKDVKLCGVCLRRAYCSRECQVADWSVKKGPGQGHKNWCKLACGEEDLYWEVAPSPGKGLGLFAKRFIPAKFRILVDAVRLRDHPAVQDLMPLDGTMKEKFDLNALDCDTESEDVLCLRIARANHSCDANADHYFDETFNVKILFAERDIQEGEEILINYQPFNDVSNSRTVELGRLILEKKFGIVCAEDCICRDKNIEKVILESKALDASIFALGSQGKTGPALMAVTKLIENHEILRSSLISKERTLYDGFQIAVTRKKTRKQAEEYIQQAYAIASSILSPLSAKPMKLEGYMKDIRTNDNYLRFE